MSIKRVGHNIYLTDDEQFSNMHTESGVHLYIESKI